MEIALLVVVAAPVLTAVFLVGLLKLDKGGKYESYL